MSYAADTSVSVAKTKAAIEDLVVNAGAKSFGATHVDGKAAVLFNLADRHVMFELPLPSREVFAKRKVRGYLTTATTEQQQKAWEQACRSKWRALYLAIKAKLVSIDAGVESFEEAFLAQIVVPDDEGRTRRFGEFAIKAIARAYTTGVTPPLLGSGS